VRGALRVAAGGDRDPAALGVAHWLGDGFELGFVMFATLLGLFSVIWGYRRHGEVRRSGCCFQVSRRCGSASSSGRCTTRWWRMPSR
jgi:hypothetical protein